MIEAWLKALFRQTSIAAWTLIGAASTLATFFPHLPHGLRPVALVVAPISFAWANYKVFSNERRTCNSLREDLSRHEARVSNLVIEPGNRSRYILRPREDVPGADVLGAVFEFHLRIENTGRRNSTITNYRVRIQELQRDYADLAVFENQTSVRGRRAQMGISRDSVLSRNGIIEVHAERTTPRGTLLFRIPDLNLQMFADAGLRMEEQDRKFSPLHCTLTISDSTGTTTSNDFVLSED